MPEYNKCSMYEKECREGLCVHKGNKPIQREASMDENEIEVINALILGLRDVRYAANHGIRYRTYTLADLEEEKERLDNLIERIRSTILGV